MRLWTPITLSAVSLLILSGCGGTPTPATKPVIDATLPIVKLTPNGAIADTNAIAFEWKSILDPRVKGFYIYKSNSAKKSAITYYDTIDNRFVTHYVDTKIKPDTRYKYFFKTFSAKAESKRSAIKVINSLPVLESVSWIASIKNMPRSAKIIWRPHTNQKVKEYIIERNTLQDSSWEKIATIKGRLNAEYIDTGLKNGYVYKYRIRVLTYDNILSTPSKIVSVITKALPKEVTQIEASRDLAKKIKITWKSNQPKDFGHYNVYRSEKSDGDYVLIAKTNKNYFIDKIKADAKQYFYRVSAVDKDNLESKYDKLSIQGLTLSKPNPPSLVEANFINNRMQLEWTKVDPRTKSYIVVKRFKDGFFKEKIKKINHIRFNKFIDSNVKPNTVYYYQVIAVDKNGIESKPSIEIEYKSKVVDTSKDKTTKK